MDSMKQNFLGKKTFNLIWEKIRTFEAKFCLLASLKKSLSWSLSSSMSETFVIEGVKMQVFKTYLVRGV